MKFEFSGLNFSKRIKVLLTVKFVLGLFSSFAQSTDVCELGKLAWRFSFSIFSVCSSFVKERFENKIRI